ncbi:Uncharacterised protein [Vibrio cholerae]|uniref:Uncharacterized protein n=1 Tax=Vibrio cholerae TaxID=666 RepID=A0A655ZLG2_VIBCL|nr:Uncharacterised protein [Vibrio cholerae]CSB72821.1 Uncharacterised protein [Vibrio cholerae]CSC75774.1 Uncharacterised protein [Vibrio cholerae]CSI72272.1 Uncharacterised protein [Vibrio cholerae]
MFLKRQKSRPSTLTEPVGYHPNVPSVAHFRFPPGAILQRVVHQNG